jgi:phosphohistidine phosphatase SixA
MTTLVLMRHGVAEDDHPGGDAARTLTADGLSRATLAARGLVALGIVPDVAVTSPLVRCRQTAALVAEAAGCPLAEDSRLAPGMDVTALLEVVLEHSGAGTILACSHQPGLSHALSDLTGCGTIGFGRPQAAVIRLEHPRIGGGRLVALLPPRILRAACTGGSPG